jgi:hypothetical protein
MRYVRRQHEATPPFAWPPTREDLDLIEVVEADTLCRVHTRCDEPEPPPAVPPDLLIPVTPVRPVPTPLSNVEPLPTPTPPPASVSPVQAWAVGLAAGWMWLATRFDGNALLAAVAVLAISLSAYLSLRTAPVPAVDVGAPVADAPAVPLPRHPAIAFARLELGWFTPLPSTLAQPPAVRTRVSSPSAPVDRKTPGRRDAQARSYAPAQLRVARGPESTSRPQSSPPVATRTRTAPAAIAPPLALNTRRSPFLSNVIESMQTSRSAFVPTITPAVDTSRRERVTPTSTPLETRSRTAAPTAQSPAPQHQQIYAALHQYERAYAQLDAQAVRAVWPSVDARALERAFHDLKSQTLVFERCDIDVARAQAVAACRGRATYETRAGQQTARSEPREWTFTLQKSDEAWRIVSASAH